MKLMTKNVSSARLNQVYGALGWAGVALILIAYILVSSGIIDGQSYAFQLLTLVGSGGLLIVSWHQGAKQSAALNLVFVLIAIYTIIRLILTP